MKIRQSFAAALLWLIFLALPALAESPGYVGNGQIGANYGSGYGAQNWLAQNTTCPSWMSTYQFIGITASAPNSIPIDIWDGSQCVPIGTLNATTHNFTPAGAGTGNLTTVNLFGGRLSLQSGMPIPTLDIPSFPTIISSNNGQTSTTGLFVADLSISIPNGQTVASLGMYASSACTADLHIVQRTSAGNYTVVATQSISLTGSGWQDVTLGTPYMVPASGNFYVGAFSSCTNVVSSINRAHGASDPSGSVTLTEDQGAGFSLRFRVGQTSYANTIYYVPCAGAVPGCGGPYFVYYNGTSLTTLQFTSSPTDIIGLTLNLHTAVQTAGNLYYLFVTNVSSTPVLGTGPAWSSSGIGTSTPGTGAGSTQLALFNGVLVNAVAMTLSYDNGGGSQTYSCPQYQCSAVGAMLASVNGGVALQIKPPPQPGGPASVLGLVNIYNQTRLVATETEATVSWQYQNFAPHDVNASANNSIEFIDPLGYSQIDVYVTESAAASSTGLAAWSSAVGYDQDCTSSGVVSGRSTGFASVAQGAGSAATEGGLSPSTYSPFPAIGLHKVTACEVTGSGSGTVPTSFFGMSLSNGEWTTNEQMRLSLPQ